MAGRLGLGVTRRQALCPFHDDHHPSLTLSPRRGTYRCYACGARGDTIDLARRLLALPFPQACQRLADAFGISLETPETPENPENPENPETRAASPARAPRTSEKTQSYAEKNRFDPARYARYFEHPQLGPEARRFLYQERRIDPRVARYCRLASYRSHLQIPYFDTQGHLTSLQLRYLGSDPAQPRFRFPAGSAPSLYNLPVLARLAPREALYIAEGPSDCWALLSAGHKAIAIPSATLLTPATARLLLRLAEERGTQFHMYPDADAPGERLFEDLQRLLPGLTRHELPGPCKDFSEHYVRTINNTDNKQ